MVCRLKTGIQKCFFTTRLNRAALKLLLTSNMVLPQSQRHKEHGGDVTAFHILVLSPRAVPPSFLHPERAGGSRGCFTLSQGTSAAPCGPWAQLTWAMQQHQLRCKSILTFATPATSPVAACALSSRSAGNQPRACAAGSQLSPTQTQPRRFQTLN